MQPQRISIRAAEDRRYRRTKSPWLLRWVVDGREHSRSFETKALAEDFAAELRRAKRDGLRFDAVTGLPTRWQSSSETFFDWAVRWYGTQQRTWSKRSRASAREALARAIVLATGSKAVAAPSQTRQYLYAVLRAEEGATRPDARPEVDSWLRRWSVPLSALDPAAVRMIADGLGMTDAGTPSAPSTAARYRKIVRRMYLDAVELHLIPKAHWPEPRKGRRRLEATSDQVDVSALPSPAVMRQIIEGVVSHQPASRGYWLLTMTAWMLGTRPSETLALRIEDFELPEDGPAEVTIRRALDGEGGLGPTKTGGSRTIDVPPALVEALREYIGDRNEGFLVETRMGNPPTLSNWHRAVKRSCVRLGVRPISLYDLRRSCAALLLSQTRAPRAVADRLGNSVEVLLRHYAVLLEEDKSQVRSGAATVFG